MKEKKEFRIKGINNCRRCFYHFRNIVFFQATVAISIGEFIAELAAYSYVKLGFHYRDEGATYAFVKNAPYCNFPQLKIG